MRPATGAAVGFGVTTAVAVAGTRVAVAGTVGTAVAAGAVAVAAGLVGVGGAPVAVGTASVDVAGTVGGGVGVMTDRARVGVGVTAGVAPQAVASPDTVPVSRRRKERRVKSIPPLLSLL